MGSGTAAYDPLCLESLAECANGRLLTQPPVVDLSP
jgi:hypothetical protein